MRIVSARWLTEQAAERDRLREQVAELKNEVLDQGRAAGRLASRTATAEGCLAGARAALAAPYREMKERCARQEAELTSLKRAYRALTAQLNDALGYSPAALSVIDADGEKALATAERAAHAAATKATAPASSST
jgi:chromosome segregation ATPase